MMFFKAIPVSELIVGFLSKGNISVSLSTSTEKLGNFAQYIMKGEFDKGCWSYQECPAYFIKFISMWMSTLSFAYIYTL